LSLEIVAAISEELFRSDGAALLNYAPCEGADRLREFIATFYHRDGLWVTAENVLITNGATEAFDLVLKLLAARGGVILVEDPSYPNHLAALRNYGMRLIPVPMDDRGIIVDDIPRLLDSQAKGSAGLIYVQPNFQNPTGLTVSFERRKRLVELATERELVILEDDPYGEIRFEGDRLPSLMSMDDGSHVISVGCFSKTVAPGLRVGWVCAGVEVIRRLLKAKMLADICTPLWSQRIIIEMIERELYWPEIARRTSIWRRRRDLMSESLRLEFGNDESATWSEPSGGWFTWMTFGGEVDTLELLEHAVQEGVSFTPGIIFCPRDQRRNSLRLCYTFGQEGDVQPGLRALRSAFGNYTKARTMRE
jgi:2-aminoadipate transaminase